MTDSRRQELIMQVGIMQKRIESLEKENTYFREALGKIAIVSDDKAKYIASRALGSYKKDK